MYCHDQVIDGECVGFITISSVKQNMKGVFSGRLDPGISRSNLGHGSGVLGLAKLKLSG